MNLMLNLNKHRPVWAPSDEGAPAPDAEPVASAEPDAAPAAQPATPNYDFIPEQFRAGEEPDLEGFKAHYDEMASAAAMREEALADVPEDASGYEFAVPEEIDFGELDLPEDFSVELKADDPAMAPLFKDLGSFMHKHNIPKGEAGELMGLLAKYEASKYAPLHATGKAEMESLGASASSRISNIERALESRLPRELAAGLKGAVKTADGVKALEKLLSPRGMPTPTTQPPTAEDDLNAYYNNPTN